MNITSEDLRRIIQEELVAVLEAKRYHWSEPEWHYDGGYGDPESPHARWYLKNEEQEPKKMTSAEKKKREQIAKALERDNPNMPMDKKMRIATAKAIEYAEGKDPKKGTGKKPKGSGRRLYTDEDPSDTVSVKFSSVSAIQKTLAKPSFKSKSHKRQSQIINLIHQRSRAAYKNAKDPKVKARLKKAYEYAEKRKEASKRKTVRLRKNKKK